MMCMALTIFHEARGESFKGQITVAATVLNRVRDTRWPNTVCEVAFQPKQFSWVENKEQQLLTPAFKQSMKVAKFALSPSFINNSCVDHYHSLQVQPTWSFNHNMIFNRIVGNHIFYCAEK